MANEGLNEHFFAFSRGTAVPSEAVADKRHRIARSVCGAGAGYVRAKIPGDGWMAWGFCPNRGAPFDSANAQAIKDAWAKAGVGL